MRAWRHQAFITRFSTTWLICAGSAKIGLTSLPRHGTSSMLSQ